MTYLDLLVELHEAGLLRGESMSFKAGDVVVLGLDEWIVEPEEEREMSKFKVGDRVVWEAPSGTFRGTVQYVSVFDASRMDVLFDGDRFVLPMRAHHLLLDRQQDAPAEPPCPGCGTPGSYYFGLNGHDCNQPGCQFNKGVGRFSSRSDQTS